MGKYELAHLYLENGTQPTLQERNGQLPPLGRKEKANRDNNLTEEIFINYSYQNCKLGDTKIYPSHLSLVYLLSLQTWPNHC
tara:strand:+ start:123 stop:368 length:246 start_codon:yes stop_codon:yes gene_type:complete